MDAKPGRTGLAKQPTIRPCTSSSTSSVGGRRAPASKKYPWDTEGGSGNCGTNFNTIQQTGPHVVYAESGFNLTKGKGSAVNGDWEIKLQDQNGTSHQHLPDGVEPSGPGWHLTWYDLNQYGYSKLSTVPVDSYILTSNGYYCTVTSSQAQITLK